jgi:hypothetical protein
MCEDYLPQPVVNDDWFTTEDNPTYAIDSPWFGYQLGVNTCVRSLLPTIDLRGSPLVPMIHISPWMIDEFDEKCEINM